MVENKAKFTNIELMSIFGAENVISSGEKFSVNSIRTDSREVTSGSLFLALKGEKVDGHNYIKKAFTSGAKVALVTKEWYKENKDDFTNKRFVLVDDTLVALGKLAQYHRLRFDIPIIAVAGSNGKTSSKEMISSVLSIKYNVLKTYANFNNQIGVPLMLLSLSSDYDIAVLEIGTNMPGEIAILADMVLPTHGIITNIGKEHLELLIDLDGVEVEETTLFAKLYNRGLCFVNIDDSRLEKYTKVIPKYISYGTSKEADVRGIINLNDFLNPNIDIFYQNRNFKIEMKSYGIHSGFNAIAATSIALSFGLSDEEISKGLSKFSPKESKNYARMLVERVGEIVLINDCYNANPSSMSATLDSLDAINVEGKKIAVLGDMLELGEKSHEEHLNILKKALDIADKVILFGKEFEYAFKSYKNIDKLRYYTDKEQLFMYLSKIVSGGDCVLVKGSRGTKMEDIIILFKKYY